MTWVATAASKARAVLMPRTTRDAEQRLHEEAERLKQALSERRERSDTQPAMERAK